MSTGLSGGETDLFGEAAETELPYESTFAAEGYHAAAFKPNTVEGANWVVRRVVEAEARIERVKAWADSEVRKAKEEAHFFTTRYEDDLRELLAKELDGKKSKTLALPDGKLSLRSVAARIEWESDEHLTQWAQANVPEAVEVVQTVKIDKREVGKSLAISEGRVVNTATGEVVSSARVIPAEERLHVG